MGAFRAELYKLRLRPVTFWLLGLGALFLLMALVTRFLGPMTTGEIAPAGVVLRRGIASAGGLLASGLIILAGSFVGSEFTWGTARTVVARGEGRAFLLVGKLGAMAVFAAVFVGLAVVVSLGFGLLAPVHLTPVDPTAAAAPAIIGRTMLVSVLGPLPYAALALLLAVVARSPTLATAGGLLYAVVGERIIGGLALWLGGVLGWSWLGWLPKLLVGTNLAALERWAAGPVAEASLTEAIGLVPVGGPLLAAVVLSVHLLVAVGLAVVLFDRYDLKAGS